MFMRNSNSLKIMGGVAVAALLVAAQARAIIAYDSPGTMVANGFPGAFILGNEFVVHSAIQVTAVGAFDSGLDGFGSATIPVALYELSGGTWSQVSGSFESFSGTVGTLVGSARFQDLASPVTLNPGTYAIVAANYGAAGAPYWTATQPHDPVPTFTSSTAISMASPNTALFAYGSTLGGTLSGVSEGSWGSPIPTWGAGTFDFTPVPEAATFGAAGVGLLGLVYIARYVQLRSKMKLA